MKRSAIIAARARASAAAAAAAAVSSAAVAAAEPQPLPPAKHDESKASASAIDENDKENTAALLAEDATPQRLCMSSAKQQFLQQQQKQQQQMLQALQQQTDHFTAQLTQGNANSRPASAVSPAKSAAAVSTSATPLPSQRQSQQQLSQHQTHQQPQRPGQPQPQPSLLDDEDELVNGEHQLVPPAMAPAPSLTSSAARAASVTASHGTNFSAPRKRPLSTAMAPAQRGSGIEPRNHSAMPAFAHATQEKPERYYNIQLTPRSTKKNKVYEDGVLAVSGRRCRIFDMSGCERSKMLASFSTEKMIEGNSYDLGSFTFELGTPLDPDEFLSGRVFVGTTYSTAKTDTAVDDGDGAAAAAPAPKARTTGASLFMKQASPHRVAPAPVNPMAVLQQAQMLDPNVLVLNVNGVRHNHEKPVIVDAFLAKLLRPHQREAVQFLYDCVMGIANAGYEGCILADAMGLGKTLTTLTLYYTLLKSGPTGQPVVKKAIVVCPATLINNWKKECTKWLGSHRCRPICVLGSLPAVEQQQLVSDFITGNVNSLLIIGYELLRKHSGALRQLAQPLLICDEGHRLKNIASNQTIQALEAIRTKKRIMLTATPVQNDLNEFFALCSFVCRDILGNVGTFRRTFEAPITRSRDANATPAERKLGEARSAELTLRSSRFMLRRSNDILLQYLPEKVEEVLFVPLSTMQKNIYKALLKSKGVRQVLFRGTGGDNDAIALQCINQLKKLCNHAALVYEDAAASSQEENSAYSFYPAGYKPSDHFASEAESSKLCVLYHLLLRVREEGQRIVVVSNYAQTLDMLGAFLQEKNMKYLRLDGSTPANERIALVDRYNSTYTSDTFVFLLSAKAGGLGLNLIGGNRLVLFDPDWNPATDTQAMSRVWRDSQKSRVYIYRFLATATIDEKIFQRQLRKTELSMAINQKGAEAAAVRNFDSKSLRDIFSYREGTTCETRDILAKTLAEHGSAEDLSLSLGDFHDNLSAALDPILRTMPASLVSAFINRVSSLDENKRLLALIAQRQEEQLERDEKREQAASSKHNSADASDSDAAQDELDDNAVTTASAVGRSAGDGDGDDDDELEYGAAGHGAAAHDDDAAAEAKSSEPKRKRRRISHEADAAASMGDDDDANINAANTMLEPLADAAAAEDDDEEDEFVPLAQSASKSSLQFQAATDFDAMCDEAQHEEEDDDAQ